MAVRAHRELSLYSGRAPGPFVPRSAVMALSSQTRSQTKEGTMKFKGRDGVEVTIPDGCHGLQGRDGRMVAIPKGGHGLQGREGRMVGIRPGGHGIQGRDGRMAAIPKGGHGLQGRDGRMVAIPKGKHGVEKRKAGCRRRVKRQGGGWGRAILREVQEQ